MKKIKNVSAKDKVNKIVAVIMESYKPEHLLTIIDWVTDMQKRKIISMQMSLEITKVIEFQITAVTMGFYDDKIAKKSGNA